MNYEKCFCAHCGQSIEYLTEGTGQTVPCPTCEKPVTLTPANPPTHSNSIEIPPAPVQEKPKEQKPVRTNLSKLTEETIRARTQKGDTPLHRAAKTGRISEIPRHLLTTELFMVTNYSFHPETPLNLAARYGHLDKVPPEFLTKETLTASTEYERKESKTGPTPPRTETPLHTAALHGHADQIPKEFLTPEFLFIEATGYRHTVLHYFALSKSLGLISKIDANSEVWNWKDSNGQTLHSILEGLIEREAESNAYIARVRSEPATEKQKEKLRYFRYAFDENISKGHASDAIDKCVRDLPELNQAYYNRPATEEQLAKLREINKHPDCGPDEPFYDFENEGPVTYGKAKDLIQEWEGLRRQKYWEEESAYQNSDEARIDEACTRIDAVRDVKREQVAKAWAIVKSRMTDKSQQPDLSEIEDTMEELFPDFRKTARDGVTYQCEHCNGIFKARLPSVGVFNLSGSIVFYSEADRVKVTIQCPSCGRDKSVETIKVCKYFCPQCLKEYFVAKSQTGQQLRCWGCRKEFFAIPSEPTPGKPTIRLMQYTAR
jgi:rubrerythrin